MAKSQQTFNKKEKEKKRLKKRKEKQEKKLERQANSAGGGLENMMMYVDEDGNLTETPPDPTVKKKEVKLESIAISTSKQEHIEEDPIKKGKVDFFNDQKGFGFIRETDTQEKYFFHVNGLIDEVMEGDKVQFELEQGMKGMNCVKVTKI